MDLKEQGFTRHKKKTTQLMRPYVQFEDLTGVTVSDSDKDKLHLGGFIAVNEKDHERKWFISQAFYDENYEPCPASAKI